MPLYLQTLVRGYGEPEGQGNATCLLEQRSLSEVEISVIQTLLLNAVTKRTESEDSRIKELYFPETCVLSCTDVWELLSKRYRCHASLSNFSRKPIPSVKSCI